MELNSSLPWFDRMINSEGYSDFIGKWMGKLNRKSLRNPAMAITNGWMAEHNENQWYADAMVERLNIFAYDNRGQGKSPKYGELDAVQGAIDANYIVSQAFERFDQKILDNGLDSQNKILQGNCVGTMYVATMFAGKMPLTNNLNGVVLISPTSTFSLPFPMNTLYFIPKKVAVFIEKYLAEPIAKMVLPGDDSKHSRDKGLERLRRIDPDAGIRQARAIFWKENVEKCWSHINVPTLILVGKNDPIVNYNDTVEVYYKLKYPIWINLDAPDHLLLESNIDYLSKTIPNFAKDPWGIYEKMKHLCP